MHHPSPPHPPRSLARSLANLLTYVSFVLALTIDPFLFTLPQVTLTMIGALLFTIAGAIFSEKVAFFGGMLALASIFGIVSMSFWFDWLETVRHTRVPTPSQGRFIRALSVTSVL